MPSQQNTFSKNERLSGEKSVANLFKEGESFFAYPFKVMVYRRLSTEKPILKLLISVSKKRFKHAVSRNRIKRLIREGWRQNKIDLINVCNEKKIDVDVALIYTATITHSFKEIEKRIVVILKRIIKENEIHHKAAR